MPAKSSYFIILSAFYVFVLYHYRCNLSENNSQISSIFFRTRIKLRNNVVCIIRSTKFWKRLITCYVISRIRYRCDNSDKVQEPCFNIITLITTWTELVSNEEVLRENENCIFTHSQKITVALSGWHAEREFEIHRTYQKKNKGEIKQATCLEVA